MNIESQKRLETPYECTWCPGCGNFGIWGAFKRAAIKEWWNNSNTVITAGVGCHGHIINFLKINAFQGLHGRAIPLAEGIKMANHKLNVFVFTGDGDCLAEGGNHLLHSARRNHNITVVLHDNAIYGLTTGQASPRSPKGFKSKSTPFGNLDEPLHPLRIALAAGATFVARAFGPDIKKLSEILIRANNHKGFAIIDVLQPCTTFNKEYTHEFYMQNMYELDDKYDSTDKISAFAKTMEWGIKKIPIGVLYESQEPTNEDQFSQIKNNTLVSEPVKKRDISKLYTHYT